MVSVIAGPFTIPNADEESKERILFTLRIAVKQIQHYCSLQSEGNELTLEVKEVRQLCECLDRAFFHGLKCYDKGFWPFVKEFTHASTIQFIQNIKSIQTEIQLGRAWLTVALNDTSLESYFRSFHQNRCLLKKHYQPLSLFCDDQRMQLILMLMAGLEFVPININMENIDLGSGLSFFNESFQSCDSSRRSQSLLKLELKSNSSKLLPCDFAAEVTCDFVSAEKSPSSSRSSSDSAAILNRSSSNDTNSSICKTISSEELELISRFINLQPQTDTKSTTADLEVVHTKFVRRTKRSVPQQETQDGSSQIESVDAEKSVENRLSKVTSDSGLSLETPCSSDSESLKDLNTEECDTRQISFVIDEFQKDFNVKFSTPKRRGSSSDGKNDFEERGTPEGQEDPAESPCWSRTIMERSPLCVGNDGKDSNEESEEEEVSIYDLHKITSVPVSQSLVPVEPESLVNVVDEGTKSVVSAQNKKPASVDIVIEEMEKLQSELGKSDVYDVKVGNNILLYFLVEVFEHEEECFHKLFYGYSNFPEGKCERIYFLLSSKSMYFLKPGNSQQKFIKCNSLRYSSISYITVDLGYQGFKVMSIYKKCYQLYTAKEEFTRNILSNLELGIRRYIPRLPLPSVYTSASYQIEVLQKFLKKQLENESGDIVLTQYVLARWEDYTSSSITPTGPIYQDFLMYRHKFVKENKATPWKPAFFLLKGGVLYCMEDEHSKPTFFIQMCAPHCKGCKRIHLLNRPHAFEIICSSTDSLQLAASDTSEVTKWLECLLETVALAGHFIDTERNVQTPCCVLLASGKILIAVEDMRGSSYKLPCKANICDLVTIFIDPMTPRFIMLEFEFAEACKSSGEWILSFESSVEKDKFVSSLKEEWFKHYQVQLSVENIKDLYLLKRYRQVSAELEKNELALREFCIDN